MIWPRHAKESHRDDFYLFMTLTLYSLQQQSGHWGGKGSKAVQLEGYSIDLRYRTLTLYSQLCLVWVPMLWGKGTFIMIETYYIRDS